MALPYDTHNDTFALCEADLFILLQWWIYA